MDSPSELLAEEDSAYLVAKGYQFEAAQVDGFVHLIIRSFSFPAAYTPASGRPALRLPPNFPLARPDMFWTFPQVKLVSGAFPTRADQFDVQYQTGNGSGGPGISMQATGVPARTI